MKKSMTALASLILCVVTGCLVLGHYFITANFAKKQQECNVLLAAQLKAAVVSKLLEPVLVARVMAHDEFLINALKAESQESEATDTAQIQAYLLRLKELFAYTSACVISNRTHRYYRDDEMHKIIDPVHDAHDIWFAAYSDGGLQFDIRVYRSARNADDSTVFVNVRIEDSDGTFLGVASTGIFVKDIIAALAEYEEKYNIKINLTDRSGLVLLGTNYADIETASLAYLVLSKGQPSNEFRYMRYSVAGFAATSFVKDLDWYFVVRSERATPASFAQQSFYLFAALLLAVAIYVLYLARKRFHTVQYRSRGKATQTDALTGLPNRNYFKDMYGERGVFNTTRYRCLAVFDIDFFKEANDSMNGDTALVSVVNHALRLLDNRGMVLRWGGDEFLMLFELPIERAYVLCRQFCKDVAAEGLVTISVGLADVRLSDTIKKNYYRAAQYCYQVKEMGGNGVKKE